ncbi:MAG: hypothetical protein J6U96_01800 [Elusimicrobiaceae bacterium]|nr:hypothetical protein [Elusimicrobiaceae bacterium]
MHKITAYLLIVIGLALMCFAFTGMYQTFVNKKPVAQIIAAQPLSVNTQNGRIELDGASIVQTLNISLFAFFMMFLVFLGSHIIGIGNNMLKTERICQTLEKLRKEDVTSHEKDIKKL